MSHQTNAWINYLPRLRIENATDFDTGIFRCEVQQNPELGFNVSINVRLSKLLRKQESFLNKQGTFLASFQHTTHSMIVLVEQLMWLI